MVSATRWVQRSSTSRSIPASLAKQFDGHRCSVLVLSWVGISTRNYIVGRALTNCCISPAISIYTLPTKKRRAARATHTHLRAASALEDALILSLLVLDGESWKQLQRMFWILVPITERSEQFLSKTDVVEDMAGPGRGHPNNKLLCQRRSFDR